MSQIISLVDLRQMYVRVEIAFWVITIQVLSESPQARRLIRFAYATAIKNLWISRIPKPILWIGAGITVGFLSGLLWTLLL